MSRKLVRIGLIDGIDAGLLESPDAQQSRHDAIEAYRSYALTQLIEAIQILDADESEFIVRIGNGVHVRPNEKDLV